MKYENITDNLHTAANLVKAIVDCATGIINDNRANEDDQLVAVVYLADIAKTAGDIERLCESLKNANFMLNNISKGADK